MKKNSIKKRKIIFYFQGGLGNQLFQFASALAISSITDREVYFDLTSYNKSFADKRSFHLDQLLISAGILPYKSNELHYWLVKILYKLSLNKKSNIFKMFNYIIETNPIYFKTKENNFNWDYLKSCNKNNTIYIYGFWMNEMYFINQKNVIIHDINQFFDSKFADTISKDILYGIHLRFFVKEDARKNDPNLFLEDSTYYSKAIEYFNIEKRAINFSVFSHDIPKAKMVLEGLGFDSVFFNYISDNDDMESFYKLSKTPNLIISNSSYSWWAAFLRNNLNLPTLTISPLECEMLPYIPKGWLQIN